MDNVITATIPEFCRISGISRARVYEMLAAGQLESVVIGRRRLIVLESYRQLIAAAERIPVPQRKKQAA
jgi:predicted DNA-binding transcriptional regulator AlpA